MTVMWKYGGVYSDLDTVTLKSFQPLLDQGKNGFGDMFENYLDMGVGVLVFQSRLEFMRYVIENFPKIYRGDEWGTNGPMHFANSLFEYCNIDNIHRHLLPGYQIPSNKTVFVTRLPNSNHKLVYMDKNHKCSNLNIFPSYYFYPLSLTEKKYLTIFKKNSSLNPYFWKAINSSFSLHYFGKVSSLEQTKPSDNSFYSILASNYCDFTFNFTKNNNLTFN